MASKLPARGRRLSLSNIFFVSGKRPNDGFFSKSGDVLLITGDRLFSFSPAWAAPSPATSSSPWAAASPATSSSPQAAASSSASFSPAWMTPDNQQHLPRPKQLPIQFLSRLRQVTEVERRLFFPLRRCLPHLRQESSNSSSSPAFSPPVDGKRRTDDYKQPEVGFFFLLFFRRTMSEQVRRAASGFKRTANGFVFFIFGFSRGPAAFSSPATHLLLHCGKQVTESLSVCV